MYCPGVSSTRTNYEHESESSDSSDSTFVSPATRTARMSSQENDHVPAGFENNGPQMSSTSSEGQGSTDSNCDPEVWDENGMHSSDSDDTNQAVDMHGETVSNLQYIVCLFLTFFQLCFHVSDKAVSYLLTFLSSLFTYLSSIVKDNTMLVLFSKSFPTTLYSLRKHLNLKGTYITYVVCPRCHKLYKESQCLLNIGGIETSFKCDHIEYPNHPKTAHRKKCGAELMKKIKIGQKYKLVPRKTYVYYSIVDSLQRLVSRPGFLEQCESWRKVSGNSANGILTDIYDGRLWKEWMIKDGIPFLELPGNLLFMLNIDWFQPFEHTQYSVGVIYIVIQNLPRAIRFKLENVIIVSTIPGPKEPNSYQLNFYLEPLVDELLKLWKGVKLSTPHSVISSNILRAALSYISSDLPATRKLCGFYGYHATYGCSKCMKPFVCLNFGSGPDYSGFDRASWQPRTHDLHLLLATRARNAATRSARERHEQEAGVRYSELLKLPYLDIVRCHLVDPMHNLFLGTSKRMLSIWKEKDLLNNNMFVTLQERMDSINPPALMGRIPSKIASGFAGFTAEQFMLWTTLFSPFVLIDILPDNHFTLWSKFSRACALLCRPYIHTNDVEEADKLLLEFCVGFEQLYGREACTPNLHMHCHLRDCILDVGPLYSFWCFSFERYNGILENMKKTWNAPERQLIHKFCNLQNLAGVSIPANSPHELVQCFSQVKECRMALPDPAINNQVVLEYEQNIFCSPSEISTIKHTFHYPFPPGKEKFMMEIDRELLKEMYNAIYGEDHIDHVPLRYTHYNQIRIFDQMFTSEASRTTRSSVIIAVWPYLSGILTSQMPTRENVRVGLVQHYMLHIPILKSQVESNNSIVEPKEHLLAYIHWYQDHPKKFMLNNGIVISATIAEQVTAASYMPVSRIISRCAVVSSTFQFDYGTDRVYVAIPLRRDMLF